MKVRTVDQPQPLYPHQNCQEQPPSLSGCLLAPKSRDRNTIRHQDGWHLSPCEPLPVELFDCADEDLNEYFQKDAVEARAQMTCETFSLHHEDASEAVVGLVSVCNDIVAVNKLKPWIPFGLTPESKLGYKEWPAVKIARLGIRKELQGNDVGTHLLNLLKTLFVCDNRTGCRVMTVDAYNNERVLKFYQKNQFQFLTEKDKNKHTRSMWFDLLPWKNLCSGEGKILH